MSIELEKFGKLEKKVIELINLNKTLREEKARADDELRAAEKRISVLEEELNELKSSRKDVLKRVDDLIRELESDREPSPVASESNGQTA